MIKTPLWTLTLVLFMLLLSPTSANVILTLTNGTQVEFEGYQSIYPGKNPERSNTLSQLLIHPLGSLTLPLTAPLTANVTLDDSKSNGIFLMMYRDLPIEQFALDAQQKGAIGIILGSSIDGRLRKF